MTIDLERFRDHARRMAAPFIDPRDTSGFISGFCKQWRFHRSDPLLEPEHDQCEVRSCSCSCHPRDSGPSTSDRELWTRLADEIDAYLNHQPPSDEQLPLEDA